MSVTLVWRSRRLAPSSAGPPKLFPRFPIQRSLQRSFPQSYFIPRFTVHHARPALPSRSLYRSSPQAISKLFPRFPLRPRSCSRKFLFTFHWLFQFFLVEAAEEVGIWNYCWFIFISRLQFGSAAVKHDSSIAAFAMADGFDPSGLSWAWKGGSQFRIPCHHPELGTWLRTPWGVDCTVLAKADWQAPEHFLPSFLACLLPSFLLSCLPACVPACLPAFLPSCLPFFLPSLLVIDCYCIINNAVVEAIVSLLYCICLSWFHRLLRNLASEMLLGKKLARAQRPLLASTLKLKATKQPHQRRHGDDMARAWWRHADEVTTTWRRSDDDIATTRRRHDDDVKTTWWRHGNDDTLPPHRQHIAATLPPHRHHIAATSVAKWPCFCQ